MDTDEFWTLPAVQAFFDHRPDFVLPAAFFDGDNVLDRYKAAVLSHSKKELVIIQHDAGSELRMTVPAHCGFKAYTAIRHGGNTWVIVAADLVQELRDMHRMAKIAY